MPKLRRLGVLAVAGAVSTAAVIPAGSSAGEPVAGEPVAGEPPVATVRPSAQSAPGFVFRHGSFTPLAPVRRAVATAHIANNDRGQIAGAYVDADGISHGFVRTGQVVRRFDVRGAAVEFPAGLNNRGQVVGFYQKADGTLHGFRRDRTGEIATVDVRGNTGLFDINDRGRVVGAYDYVANSGHGFVRGPQGKVTTIDVPGAGITIATGINDRGQVVGGYVDAGAEQNPDGTFPLGSVHGFRWSEGSLIRFDVPGATLTASLGINDRGQICGEYVDGRGRQRGFVLHRGSITTIDAPHRADNIAWGINDRGEIVVPEPGTGLLGLG